MHWGLQIYRITKKDSSPLVHGRQAVCKKKKKRENDWRLIQTISICSYDIRIESGIDKCAMFIMKSGKR